ncbi:hypothetical protein [Alkalicoccobacillus plakortidis]|uniref:Fur-regulated basic protein B n=1 Tax=Alkalicoccobacillus plakortidis TaxID=444060 RepID=A0ABT0XEV3_9BACI|nr:hypothetical protein [Alkalicoccobacillus plakortidis]MCM2674402.1 hypothetical protein [Alkalicoccobacillus plakortidis]
MASEHTPSLNELKEKINVMKRDQREYKAEAFIEIYDQYIARLEQELDQLRSK